MARQRGPNSWEEVVWVGTKRVRRSFQTEAEATKWREESEAKIKLGIPIDGPPPQTESGGGGTGSMTLGELFDRVHERIWKGSRGEDTAVINAEAVKDVLGAQLPIADITVELLDTLIAKLRATGNADSTINRKLAALSKSLNFAVERGWIVKCPTFTRLPETQGRIRFVTPEEEANALAYFTWAGDNAMADLWKILVDTGLRLGEALRLQVKDVDLKAKPTPVIRVWENKADLPRSVPCTSRVKAVLEARCKLKTETAEVFSDLDKRAVRYRWDKMALKMGLGGDDQFVPHVLRHTTASRLIQRGVPLKVVQEWLGHRTIQTTMRYAHLAPANLFAAVSALEVAPDQKSRYDAVAANVA
jgi:integrase